MPLAWVHAWGCAAEIPPSPTAQASCNPSNACEDTETSDSDPGCEGDDESYDPADDDQDGHAGEDSEEEEEEDGDSTDEYAEEDEQDAPRARRQRRAPRQRRGPARAATRSHTVRFCHSGSGHRGGPTLRTRVTSAVPEPASGDPARSIGPTSDAVLLIPPSGR